MKIQKILPISMACLFFAASVHAQEPVKALLNPQQVTDLFIKTLVHTDATAMKALNEYQRPARAEAGNSGDFIDIEKMQETDRIYADHLAPKFLANMKLTVEEQKALLPDTVALLQSVRDAQKRTVCTTGEAKPQTEGVRQGVVSILVPFACKAVNPTEKVTAMMRRPQRIDDLRLYELSSRIRVEGLLLLSTSTLDLDFLAFLSKEKAAGRTYSSQALAKQVFSQAGVVAPPDSLTGEKTYV